MRISKWIPYAAAVLLVAGLLGQRATRKPMRLDIDDPRPVAKAAEMLEARFGWIITYEDPRWSLADAVDVTTKVRKDLDQYKAFPHLVPRVWIPRGGRFDLSIAMPEGRGERLNGMSVLNDVLARNMAARNPGVYRIQQTEGRYHILPVSNRGADGRTVAQNSVLDATIDLPSRQSNVIEMLDTFTEALSKASGRRVVPGAMPVLTFGRHHATYAASGETARSFLARSLDGIGPGYSWQLLNDPGEDTLYLNIHWIGNLKAEN